MAVSPVWRLAYLIAPCPVEPRITPKHIWNAPCSSPKIQKQAFFGISLT
jgi:hypothetical protein